MQHYFEHQETAYRRSDTLFLWLSLAVGLTVLVTGIVFGYSVSLMALLSTEEFPLSLFLESAGVAMAITAVFVGSVSVLKICQLRAGGATVAEELGGTLVTPDTRDADLRKVRNVVEEMAIASGIAPPPVYVLSHENGINAFAAGYELADAVIGVTAGCARRLTREQLQGVIAHEFSHIFNGDMCLNTRMMGALHGLLAITTFAEGLIRLGHDIMEKDERDSFLGCGIMLLGRALWPIGAIGFLSGAVVRAAMNRQREFLADAFAVQFTRNPAGLAGALKVIGGYDAAGRVRTPKAIEVSQMFFVDSSYWFRLLRTHPPLPERIRRIEPDWNGAMLFETEKDLRPYDGAFHQALGLVAGNEPEHSPDGVSFSSANDNRPLCPWTHAHADEIAASLPSLFLDLAGESAGAAVLLHTLWQVGGTPADRYGVPRELVKAVSGQLRHAIEALQPHAEKLDSAQRLLLFDKAVDSLRHMSPAHHASLETIAQTATRADDADTFRWMWRRVVARALAKRRGELAPQPRFSKLDQARESCAVVLSAIVAASGDGGPLGEYTFHRGTAQLGLSGLEYQSTDQVDPRELEEALERIAEVAPRARRQLLVAIGACISADREVSEAEAHLVRGICDGLNYAAPSLMPGQPIAPGV